MCKPDGPCLTLAGIWQAAHGRVPRGVYIPCFFTQYKLIFLNVHIDEPRVRGRPHVRTHPFHRARSSVSPILSLAMIVLSYRMPLSPLTHSGRRRRDDHVGRYTLAHAPGRIPRFGLDRRSAHRVRVRHERKQSGQSRPGRLFHLYALVGQAQRLVCFLSLFFFFWLFTPSGRADQHRTDGDGGVLLWRFISPRTWVLLLGMSGLIVLFWLLNGGEVLRYLVSASFP